MIYMNLGSNISELIINLITQYTVLKWSQFFFRFAQFFLCPLFTPSATEREVNAVNSENDKNIKDDGRRLYQLSRATANQKHPYSKFSTGVWSNCTEIVDII